MQLHAHCSHPIPQKGKKTLNPELQLASLIRSSSLFLCVECLHHLNSMSPVYDTDFLSDIPTVTQCISITVSSLTVPLPCSNPVVQVKAAESGALQMLLTILATEQPLRVKKKVRTQTHVTVHCGEDVYKHTAELGCSLCVCQVLFAVASLLRNFPFAQRHFLSHGGLQVLSELFRADGGGVLRTRIVTMLYDMISEKVHKQTVV